MSALPPKADISFYEHTDFRPSLISIASATKRPDNPLIFCTSRPPKADIGESDWACKGVLLSVLFLTDEAKRKRASSI
jgi:hypothetical protein